MSQKEIQSFYQYVCKLFVLNADQPFTEAKEIEQLVSDMLKASCTMDNIKSMLNQQTEFDVLEQIRQLKLYKETASKLREEDGDQEGARITKLTQENGELNRIIKDLRASADECFSELAETKEQFTDEKELLQKSNGIIAKQEGLAAENERLAQTRDQLNGRINQLTIELQESRQLLAEEAQKTQSIEQQMRNVNESAQESIRLYQDAQKQNEKYESIIDNMRRELDTEKAKWQEEHKGVEMRVQNDLEEQKRAAAEIATLKSQLADAGVELRKAQEELRKANDAAAMMKKELQNSKNEVKSVAQELEIVSESKKREVVFETEIEQLKKDISALQLAEQKAAAAELQIKKREQQITDLRQQIAQLETVSGTANDPTEQLQALERQYVAKCAEADEANEDLESLMSQAKKDEEAIMQLREEVSQKDRDVSELKEVVGVLEMEVAEYKEMINKRFE